MRRVNRPPVVGKHIEDTEDDHEECGGPLGLEANSYHHAGSKANNGHENTHDAPFTLDHEAQEEENE